MSQGNDGHTPKAWWETSFAIIVLLLLSTVPLWFSKLPPLIDLLGHMGRYYIQLNLNNSEILRKNWDFQWQLVANLGVDLLMFPFSFIFGFERAVWLIAMLLPPLMISGIIRISRALHGQVTPFVFVAAPLALAMPWQWGLVNYWLSAGLAFHAFATWVAADLRRWSAMRRAAVFAVVTPIIWLSHVYGWAIFLVLVFSYEITRKWGADVRDLPKVAGQILVRIWPVALPIVLTLIWQHGREGAETSGFFYFRHKLYAFTYVLRDQNIVVDIVSQLFILCSSRKWLPSALSACWILELVNPVF